MLIPKSFIAGSRFLIAIWCILLIRASVMVYLKIVSSASDDNPVALLLILGAFTSLLPFGGSLVSWQRKSIPFWLWLALSLAILSTFSIFLSAFLK
jgi:hypothetical protein